MSGGSTDKIEWGSSSTRISRPVAGQRDRAIACSPTISGKKKGVHRAPREELAAGEGQSVSGRAMSEPEANQATVLVPLGPRLSVQHRLDLRRFDARRRGDLLDPHRIPSGQQSDHVRR